MFSRHLETHPSQSLLFSLFMFFCGKPHKLWAITRPASYTGTFMKLRESFVVVSQTIIASGRYIHYKFNLMKNTRKLQCFHNILIEYQSTKLKIHLGCFLKFNQNLCSCSSFNKCRNHITITSK